MSAQVSHEEIRRMVRELLRDAVAGVAAATDGTEAGRTETGGTKTGGTEATVPSATPAGVGRPAEVGAMSERVRAALEVGGGAIEIAIASDSDLNAFAQQVALCALERDLLGAIASNRVRFRLAGRGGQSGQSGHTGPVAAGAAAAPAPDRVSAAGSAKDGDAYHWEQGLLSETKITEIARTHAKLVLGRRALLTPLAWDRARSLGLHVMRMKP